MFRDADDLRARWVESHRWTPALAIPDRDRMVHEWSKAVGRSLDWIDAERRRGGAFSPALEMMSSPILGEFAGTFVLVLLGDGVVAGVLLNGLEERERRLDCDRNRLGARRDGRRLHGQRPSAAPTPT